MKTATVKVTVTVTVKVTATVKATVKVTVTVTVAVAAAIVLLGTCGCVSRLIRMPLVRLVVDRHTWFERPVSLTTSVEKRTRPVSKRL